MYEDPGYSVFNWRSEEGIQPRGQAGRKAATSANGHSWEQQYNANAAKQREIAMRDEQERQKQLAEAQLRAQQYGDASQGVGPEAFQAAPEPDPKTMYQTGYDPTTSVIY